MQINYVFTEENRQDDTLVCLLHGWGANLDLFDAATREIAQKCPVLRFDFPGMGKSAEPPTAWSLDDYTDFTIRFVANFAEPRGFRKVIFLGHSFGGRVIIKLANRSNLPFELPKLILVDAAGIKPPQPLSSKIKLLAYKALGKGLLSRVAPAQFEKWRASRGSADYNAASERMKQVLVKTVAEDLTPLLAGVKPETLLFWGENDAPTPLADAQKMEKLLPNAGLVVAKGAGHYSFLDDARLFALVLRSFLEIGEANA